MSPSTTTNRLTTSATYDDSGNQTAWGSWLYGFDGLNMMQSNNNGSRTLRYVYTADDERIAIHDGTTVKWRLRGVDNKVLREYRLQGGTWSWLQDHVYRGSSLLATDEPTIGVRHFALDHLGTPRLITSSTGATVSLHNYYPFGQESTSETQDAEVMKFTGHERDMEANGTGGTLDYMHARYYSPVMGRFLSVDPVIRIERMMRTPQRWNRYNYAQNNPLGNIDPDGRWTVSLGLVGTWGAGPRASGEVALAVDTEGTVAILSALEGGGGAPELSVQGRLTGTRYESIGDQLNADTISAGVGGGLGPVGGADVILDPKKKGFLTGFSISGGTGSKGVPPIAVEAHAMPLGSSEIVYSINIPEKARDVKKMGDELVAEVKRLFSRLVPTP